MTELFKLIEVPSLIFAAVVLFLMFKIIMKLLDVTERNGKAIQELTTWLKARSTAQDDS